MKLIIGLGNPGEKYAASRHNIGYLVLERVAAKYGFSLAPNEKFLASVAEGLIEQEKVVLGLPLTYMNSSGQAVAKLVDYFKVNLDGLLVISDDLDLPFGTIRTRFSGGDGGQKGLRSVIEAVGEDFWRLRIGIANEHREGTEASDFVLKPFNRQEAGFVDKITESALEVVSGFLDSKLEEHSLDSLAD